MTLLLAGAATAADNVTRCGAALIKADFRLADAIIKEAGRACGTAAADDPATVEAAVLDDKLVAATQKFNDAIANAVADFGQSNCYLEVSVNAEDPAQIVADTEDLASDFCDSDFGN